MSEIWKDIEDWPFHQVRGVVYEHSEHSLRPYMETCETVMGGL